jgi:Ca2+-binding RTX toxin-like protein
MAWTGVFNRNSSDFFRALEGYFLVDGASIGFSRPITVVSATAERVVLRDFGVLGEITFIGQGLTLAQTQVPGVGGPFPQFTGGTITTMTSRFNATLDMLTAALALADTAAQRSAIEAQIATVISETNAQLQAEAQGRAPAVSHLVASALVVPGPPIAAAQLGTAAAQSFITRSIAPMRDFLNQFTVDFAGPGAPGGFAGQGFDLIGFDGPDRLTGGPGNDQIIGNGGNDTLDGGGAGIDIYFGGAGSDLYILGAERDSVTDDGPMSDVDLVSYQNAPTGVHVSMDIDVNFPGTGWAAGDIFGGIEGIIGSDFDDWLIGRSTVWGDLSADILIGGAGNDTLTGGEGADTLVGGPGDDLLDGGGNRDQFGNPGRGDMAVYEAGPNEVHFFVENGALHVATPREGVDVLIGIELVSLAGQVFSIPNQINLSPAIRRFGGPQPDVLTGDDRTDLIFGRGGNDTLHGMGGNDIIDGGAGNDRLDGGVGNDTLSGGDGTDTILGGAGDDLIFGGTTRADLRDVIYGGDGNDTAYGGAGNDELRGDAGSDLLFGDTGADTLIGGTGNDTLEGGALGDVLFGGAGDDFLNGGFGFDRLNGGAGADTFFHLGIRDHGSDWIQDYNAAERDVLQFGQPGATRAQFQINIANTPNAGAADVAEAFVIYRPTGQIIWALVDGMGQDSINLRIGGQVFDLLA